MNTKVNNDFTQSLQKVKTYEGHRILITGDIHGEIDIDKLSFKNSERLRKLTKDDYVIICGDFGLIWYPDGVNKQQDYWKKWLNHKPWTTLFIDGNHENFDLLNKYPTEIWNGGTIHRISDKIIHLTRAQIFNIGGLKFFTFGGATSTDKENRKLYIDWWPEEEPSYLEYKQGYSILNNNNATVDYIITHDAPYKIVEKLYQKYKSYSILDSTPVQTYFDSIYDTISFKQWFCGHHHVDLNIDKVNFLYDNIIEV